MCVCVCVCLLGCGGENNTVMIRGIKQVDDILVILMKTGSLDGKEGGGRTEQMASTVCEAIH